MTKLLRWPSVVCGVLFLAASMATQANSITKLPQQRPECSPSTQGLETAESSPEATNSVSPFYDPGAGDDSLLFCSLLTDTGKCVRENWYLYVCTASPPPCPPGETQVDYSFDLCHPGQPCTATRKCCSDPVPEEQEDPDEQ